LSNKKKQLKMAKKGEKRKNPAFNSQNESFFHVANQRFLNQLCSGEIIEGIYL
jgi:hypothetical protein